MAFGVPVSMTSLRLLELDLLGLRAGSNTMGSGSTNLAVWLKSKKWSQRRQKKEKSPKFEALFFSDMTLC